MRATLLLLAATLCRAQDFEADLQPVFRKYCLDCHAHGVKMGSLDLETIGGIRAGGNHGQIVTPGKADESRLYLMAAGKKEPFMPMDGRSLAAAELDVIKNWINAGAKGPAVEAAPAPPTPSPTSPPASPPSPRSSPPPSRPTARSPPTPATKSSPSTAPPSPAINPPSAPSPSQRTVPCSPPPAACPPRKAK